MLIKQKIAKYMTVIVFASLIFLVTIINLFTPDKGFSESENRYLQKQPTFTFDNLLAGKFTADFETYMTDQFVWRDGFIGVKTQAEYIVGKKDSNGVYFASDGYLIEKHDIKDIDYALLDRNIKRLYEFTETTSQKLGDNKVSVMLIPTSSNVLKNTLPPFTSGFDQDSVIDEIKNGLPNNGIFVDLRDTLTEHSNEYIYYKTDHHWTSNGAYYAYKEWSNRLGINGYSKDDFNINPVTESFYGTVYTKARLVSTKPDTIYTYVPKTNPQYSVEYNLGERTENTLYADKYLTKRDKYAYFLNGNNPIVKIISPNKNSKKLLIIKDSFSHSFAPFVVNDFEEVHMLDLRYLNISIQDYIDEHKITDALFMFNTINFAKETTLINLNK